LPLLDVHSGLRLAIAEPGVDVVQMRSQISNYFYEKKKQSPALALGVSSFGTASSVIENHVGIDVKLSSPDADLFTTGVIGSVVDPESQTIIAMFSSVKGAMDLLEQTTMGYDEGLVTIDETFQITYEGVNILTMATTDIQQVHKYICIHVNTYKYICICTYSYICIRTYSHIHMHTHMCMHTYACMHMHTYICIHTCAYMHVHTYMCTLTK
jgi:hypothetical protein